MTIIVVLTVWAVSMMMKSLNRTGPALVIDEQGLTDRSNMTGVGLIAWDDIVDIKEVTNALKKDLIIILVKNPEDYINRASRLKESL